MLSDRIREILNEFRTANYHCGYKEGLISPCKCADDINKALSAILAEIREIVGERMPKEKISCVRKMESCGECHQCMEDKGYNEALTDIITLIKEG